MKRLLAIQNELKAPKGQFNKFGGYKYRSCEDIIEAVKPLLKKHELVLNMSDTIELIGDRYYVKADVTVKSLDGTIIGSASAYAREEESKKGMDGSQITGSSSSYARKYALNGLFAIDDGVDSDLTNKGNDNTDQKTESPNAEEKPRFNKEQLELFTKAAGSYENADEALKVIKTKYRIGKEKEAEVRKLYESLKTINDNN